MKKKLIIVSSVFVVLALALTLFACGSKHEHDYSEKYESNDTQHWLECRNDGCDRPRVEQGDHYDGNKDGACDVCGRNMLVKAESVSLNETTINLNPGDTFRLTATVTPAAAAVNKDYKWSSDDTNVASVYHDGTVKALNVGTTKIKVLVDKATAECTVNVTSKSISVQSVALPAEFMIAVDDIKYLVPDIEPQDATNRKVTWKSDDTEIATIDESGMLKGKKLGSTNITVTTEDGNKTATCKVTVGIAVEKIDVDCGTEITLKVGDRMTFATTVKPDNATVKAVKWQILDDVAGVVTLTEDGELEAIGGGTALCEATPVFGYSGIYTVVTVHVDVPVESVSFEQASINVDSTDNTKILTPVIAPANATNKNVTWKSSDESVLTVDENGKITPVSKGTATVTVTTEDGEYTADCEVEVVVFVTGIKLEETSVTIGRGRTKQLHPIFTPANPTNTNLYWSVSPENMGITVDDDGLVTASDEAEGVVTVSVRTEDGNFYAECEVAIGIPVESVSIHNTRDGNITDTVLYLTYNEGFVDTYKIFEVINPYEASNKKVTWEVSNPYVIELADDGTVTAIGLGTSNVTVTTDDGGFTAVCGFIVKDLLQYVSISDGSAYMVTSVLNTEATSATIPAEHDGKPVTAIGGATFTNNSVRSLKIPDTVTTIGDNLFMASRYVTISYLGTLAQWCAIPSVKGVFCNPDHTTVYVRSDDGESWLRLQGDKELTVNSLTLPDGMESIGKYALYESNITDISLPASMREIGENAFNAIGAITITFRGTIGQWCEIEGLEKCMATDYYSRKVIIDGTDISTLETIVIEDGTTKIAEGAFHIGRYGYSYPVYNDTLKSVIIPASVESIGNKAFKNCRTLTTVYFKGTEEQWDDMTRGTSSWYEVPKVYYYSQEMPNKAGDFWHFDEDGETPVIWTEFNIVHVESIELEHSALQLAEGEQVTLKAFAYPENASQKEVTWEIPDPYQRANASIDWQTGELKIPVGASAGATVTVRATSKDSDNGYITAECTVTIGRTVTYDRRKSNGTDFDEEWYAASSSNYFSPTKVVLASVCYPMGGNGRTSYEVTEIGSGAFKTLSVLEEIWIPSTVTKISTEQLFHQNVAVTIYYDITLEEAAEMDLSGFFAGAADGVERKVYFRNPETGRIDVPMPQED